jgi:hypothetical protein
MYCMPVMRPRRTAQRCKAATLEKIPWTAKVEGPDRKALVYRGGDVIGWKVVAS